MGQFVVSNEHFNHQWKTYITEALDVAERLIFWHSFILSHKLSIITEEEEKPEVQDEGRANEGEKHEPEGVAEGMTESASRSPIDFGD
jgi:hypothetical protein